MKERVRFRRGGYIIPSLFTTGNLLCGYIAVIRSLESEFEWAAIAIAIAAILDRLDGWVARLTGTTSDFGVQLDSLADIISFGMAPAVLVYTWALADLQKPWSLVPFLYLAAGATRLARFNVSSPSMDNRYFVGLPIPAAACVLTAFVYYNPARIDDPIAGALIAVMVATVATLMVSKVRYRSFKEIELKGRIRWIMVSMMALVYLLVATSPRVVLLALSFSYLLSGLFPRLSPQSRPEPQTAQAEGRHGGG